jgi:hypothetical protein
MKGKKGRKGPAKSKFLVELEDIRPVRVWWDAEEGAIWFRRKNSRHPLRLLMSDAWRAINEGGLTVSFPVASIALEPHPELFTIPAGGACDAAGGSGAVVDASKGTPALPQGQKVADR